jgi:hypothetical protein
LICPLVLFARFIASAVARIGAAKPALGSVLSALIG